MDNTDWKSRCEAAEATIQRICIESGVVLFGDGVVRNHRAEQAEARIADLEKERDGLNRRLNAALLRADELAVRAKESDNAQAVFAKPSALEIKLSQQAEALRAARAAFSTPLPWITKEWLEAKYAAVDAALKD